MEQQTTALLERVRALEAEQELLKAEQRLLKAEQKRQGRQLRLWQGGLAALAALCLLLQSPGGRPAQADPPGRGGVPRLEERITAAEKNIATLDQRVTGVEQGLAREIQDRLKQTFTIGQRLARLEFLLDCVERVGNDLFFVGCNVHIRNGLGATNGLGNLIIGYNEPRPPGQAGFDRSGSHNLILGVFQSYSSFGGLVLGKANTIRAPYASVGGGLRNTASGPYSSVSGGVDNHASGPTASVSGGVQNTADGASSSVSGGARNAATFFGSSVSGGEDNRASGISSSVSGGRGNHASGFGSSVSGGLSNGADHSYSSVSGGEGNRASGLSSSVSGGLWRSVSGALDWRAGSLFQDR